MSVIRIVMCRGVALVITPTILCAILCACRGDDSKTSAAASANGAPWFERIVNSGVDFVHVSGKESGHFYFPEISTGGVCLIDYDGDGRLDLYFVQGGSLGSSSAASAGNRLYRNLGDWKFEDVTESAGVGDTGYGMGCACGDYDNDGDTDLYVTNLGPNVLYRNNGDGSFSDVTDAAGVSDPGWSTGAVFVDYDADGAHDLYVVNYIHWSGETEKICFSARGPQDYCSPKNYNAPARDTLYRNRGDGSFEDVSVSAGLDRAFGNGFGVVAADFNQDANLDFYITNDGTPNQLWMSDGKAFTDRAMLSGCAVNQHGWAEAGMGIAAHDVDDDGDLDLFMTHLEEESNTLYRNNGGRFVDDTAGSGMAKVSVGVTGWGVGFADFDHDGYADVYVANGRVKRGNKDFDPADPYAEPDHVLRGLAGGRYEEVKPRGGTAELLAYTGRGAAFGDVDNDGDIDVVVTNRDAAPLLLRNIASTRGHWLAMLVLDEKGHECPGAMVSVRVGERTQSRLVGRGYSYCASNDPRVHFGVGRAERVDEVTVRWQDGSVESFGALEADRAYTLKAGAGAASAGSSR
jgi:hypothetical protein